MLRILLVDDEPAIVEDLKHMLASCENVEVAASYTDPLIALKEFSSLKVDCAFLDIEMAGINGIELAERMMESNPDLEVVFVTAYNHYAAQAFDVNAIDYLLKPIRPERLAKALEKIAKKDPNLTGNGMGSIRCFGALEVLSGEKRIKWTRSKSKELFAYLLQHEGKWISKYKLCDEQWPEYGPEQALAYLQTSIYALRKSLREIGFDGIRIQYADDRYQLKLQQVFWDVKAFEESIERFQKTGSMEDAQKALELYRGEYLEDEDWLWSEIHRAYYERRILTLKKAMSLD